jgi:hypothetical protein
VNVRVFIWVLAGEVADTDALGRSRREVEQSRRHELVVENEVSAGE